MSVPYEGKKTLWVIFLNGNCFVQVKRMLQLILYFPVWNKKLVVIKIYNNYRYIKQPAPICQSNENTNTRANSNPWLLIIMNASLQSAKSIITYECLAKIKSKTIVNFRHTHTHTQKLNKLTVSRKYAFDYGLHNMRCRYILAYKCQKKKEWGFLENATVYIFI